MSSRLSSPALLPASTSIQALVFDTMEARRCHKFFLGAMVFVISAGQSAASPNRLRLISKLLREYSSLTRPVLDDSEIVLVNVEVQLRHVHSYDPVTGELDVSVSLKMNWKDVALAWDGNEYGGINSIILPSKHLWTPDITVMELIKPWQVLFPGGCSVQMNGNVTWVINLRLQTMCEPEVNPRQPTQSCALHFYSWMHNGFQLDLAATSGTDPLSSYKPVGVWMAVGATVQRNNVYYACCPEPFPNVRLNLELEKQSAITSATTHPFALSVQTFLAVWFSLSLFSVL